MKSTEYFRNKVMQKRPYLKAEWIEDVVSAPEHTETEEGGRVRCWGYVDQIGKYLRVVVLEDGVTVHNAFPDRRYSGERIK